MKSRKIMIIVASIAVLLSIGGCTVKHKDDTKQGKTIAASSTKDLKEDEETIKKKQLDYLKEHEQEIVDLVKAQNSKVESVQIDWDQTQWGDGGLTTPEYYMNVFGRINNIEESGWGVDIPINEDNTLNLDEMYVGSYIRVGGKLFD
ncbi:hypothetical protein [Streptococcus sp. HMSC076C09]|uniref:hypothetical protein n=1 Tax=Streptococcus sp. HMSC076C09 TaxID=1715183 RepID=UPI0008A8E098|nr:hypothetical protein [Streptococcus sp. HMSC076C09]OHQ86943.1 hypothetical protein HMPREF2704_10195 [Streptococcus sp. HMSC076C09]